jgi:hypothetical protein
MKKTIFLMIILLVQLSSSVFAQEVDEFTIFNLEAEKLLNLGSGILALVLFIVSLVAYKRTKSKKLVYVSTAFGIFAVKSLLISMELFFGDLSWIDPVASILDFGILLAFFAGMLKK